MNKTLFYKVSHLFKRKFLFSESVYFYSTIVKQEESFNKLEKFEHHAKIDDLIKEQDKIQRIIIKQPNNQIQGFDNKYKKLQKLKSLDTPSSQIQLMNDLQEGALSYRRLDEVSIPSIMTLLKNQQLLQKKYILAFNNLLSYVRKNKIVKTYETIYFKDIINLISNNIEILHLPENISAFAFNLYRMKWKEVEPYILIEKIVRKNIQEYSLQSLANILFSFTYISRKQNLNDFSSFFIDLQTTLAIKLRYEKNVNEKDITQIIVAYSKSQNMTKEFSYVIEQISLENFHKLSTREISILLYTFTLNDYISANLIEKSLKHFLSNSSKYKIQEICHLLLAVDKFECNLSLQNKEENIKIQDLKNIQIQNQLQINSSKSNQQLEDYKQQQNSQILEVQQQQEEENNKLIKLEKLQQKTTISYQYQQNKFLKVELLQRFQKEFLLRRESCNIVDNADFAQVFFRNEFVQKEFIDCIRNNYRNLRANLDSLCLSKFLTNSGKLLNKGILPHRFFKELMKTLVIQKETTPTKIQGFENQLRNEAIKLNHYQFRQLFLNALRGLIKLKHVIEKQNHRVKINFNRLKVSNSKKLKQKKLDFIKKIKNKKSQIKQ